jgi:hypothetical protein
MNGNTNRDCVQYVPTVTKSSQPPTDFLLAFGSLSKRALVGLDVKKACQECPAGRSGLQLVGPLSDRITWTVATEVGAHGYTFNTRWLLLVSQIPSFAI